MRKLLLSLFILLIIIISGLAFVNLYSRSSCEMVEIIDSISGHVRTGSWNEAAVRVEEMERRWDSTKKSWEMLTDHFEIDNIEMSMKKSREYIYTRNTPLSLAELANLKFMVEHIYEKEKVTLKNIF